MCWGRVLDGCLCTPTQWCLITQRVPGYNALALLWVHKVLENCGEFPKLREALLNRLECTAKVLNSQRRTFRCLSHFVSFSVFSFFFLSLLNSPKPSLADFPLHFPLSPHHAHLWQLLLVDLFGHLTDMNKLQEGFWNNLKSKNNPPPFRAVWGKVWRTLCFRCFCLICSIVNVLWINFFINWIFKNRFQANKNAVSLIPKPFGSKQKGSRTSRV